MTSTNYTKQSTVSTDYALSTALEDGVRLDSTTVTLDSLTVTLLGYTAGANINDNTVSTNYTPQT